MAAFRIVLIAGSLVFLAAAFFPLIYKVIMERDAEKQRAMIRASFGSWRAVCVLFGSSGLVTAAGIALLASELNSVLAWSAAAAALIGAVCWGLIQVQRVRHSSLSTPNSKWAFPAYTLLTQGALIALGAALLQAGVVAWVGWMLVILTGLLVAAYFYFKDVAPFVYYLLTLIAAVGLPG